MANFVNGKGEIEQNNTISSVLLSRKEKRKVLKKLKRKQTRTESALRKREEEEARLNDQEEQHLLWLREQLEAEQSERNMREFEERERVWLEEAAARKARQEEVERLKNIQEENEKKEIERAYGLEDDDEYEFIEEGPPEIIWHGNEIIIKKRRVKVAKRVAERVTDKKDDDMPTSNPLPPQSVTFESCAQGEPVTVQGVLDRVAQQVPNFGTEQDKAHCPFHLKTGVCRFGTRCSRVHFYPDKSCTLLLKNMYNGPGLICEHDEGLEYTDEEVERCYEEFYEDVHTEFLKFGEIINFKVCKNTSYHLRGNLYVHYKSLESAISAYNTLNSRYYAGKQIVCEFAGVTKWKAAICGEFMKSRLKTCSHGSACNFIHCFHNPGGDYEWANWDNPPPKFWIKKMVALFGASVESNYEKDLESDDYYRHREPKRTGRSRSYSHQSEMQYGSSDEDELNSKNQYIRQSIMREHSSKSRGHRVSADKNEQLIRNHNSEEHVHSRSFCFHWDEANEGLFEKHQRADSNMPQNCSRHESRHKNEDKSSSGRKREVYSEVLANSESDDKLSNRRKRKIYSESESGEQLSSRRQRKVYIEEQDNSESEDRSYSRRKMKVYSKEKENSEIQDGSSSRRKRRVYSEEQDNSECKSTSKSYKKHSKKHDPSDRYLASSDHGDSFSKHSFGSQNQFDGKNSSKDLDTERYIAIA